MVLSRSWSPLPSPPGLGTFWPLAGAKPLYRCCKSSETTTGVGSERFLLARQRALLALKRPMGDINARKGGELPYWSPLPSSPGLGPSCPANPFPSFSTPYRTSTSLNLTPLNSTQLNSLFDPPRPPFWSLLGAQIDPRSAPSRLLTPYFSKT